MRRMIPQVYRLAGLSLPLLALAIVAGCPAPADPVINTDGRAPNGAEGHAPLAAVPPYVPGELLARGTVRAERPLSGLAEDGLSAPIGVQTGRYRVVITRLESVSAGPLEDVIDGVGLITESPVDSTIRGRTGGDFFGNMFPMSTVGVGQPGVFEIDRQLFERLEDMWGGRLRLFFFHFSEDPIPFDSFPVEIDYEWYFIDDLE